jgi:hypothetical protein
MRTTLLVSGILAGMLTMHGCGGGSGEETKGPQEHSAPARSMESCQVLEPTIPGYTPGAGQVPRLLLGIDLWAPWAVIDPEDGGNLKGLLPEFMTLMQDQCTDVDVEWIHTAWGDCFAEPEGKSWVGGDIKTGAIHGCMGYTHTQGTRNRLFEFSDAVTMPTSRTAGFIVRLKADGTPEIDGKSDMKGVKVVDVAGWAPTGDNIQMATNDCTGAKFAYTDITFVPAAKEGNFEAMRMLKAKEADAMWVYSDQALTCAEALDTDDCKNWAGLGTEYAYIHSGMPFALNGTTMVMSKRGSGIAKLINPCIKKVLATKAYKDLCDKHKKYEVCYRNEFFTEETIVEYYNKMHSKKTGAEVKTCADGYCPCPA